MEIVLENRAFENTNLSSLYNSTSSKYTDNSILLYIDYVVRWVSLTIHLGYFVAAFTFKALRNIRNLFLHNINFISFLYCAHYCFYIGRFSFSAFASPVVNHVFCTLSEVAWISLKFLRVYSIVLLAAYRYMAVYRGSLFKKLNANLSYMVAIIIALWLASIGIALALKYGLNIPYIEFYCLEGFSPYAANNIAYWTITIVLVLIIPTTLVLIAYSFIIYKTRKLKSRIRRVNNANRPTVTRTGKIKKACRTLMRTQMSSGTTTSRESRSQRNSSSMAVQILRRRRQSHIARQIIIVNVASFLGTVLSILVNTHIRVSEANIELKYIDDLETVRPLFRIIFLTSQATIPVVSMYYAVKNQIME